MQELQSRDRLRRERREVVVETDLSKIEERILTTLEGKRRVIERMCAQVGRALSKDWRAGE